jgi:hypothetical protein
MSNRPPTVSNSFKSRQIEITEKLSVLGNINTLSLSANDLSASNVTLNNLNSVVTPGTSLTASVSSLVIKVNGSLFRIPLLSI